MPDITSAGRPLAALLTYRRYVTSRLPTHRAARTLAAVAIAAVTAAGLATLPAGPAHAIAIPVRCDGATADEVTIAWDDLSYELSGVCGTVRITADHAEVTIPTATRVIVEGSGNVVRTKSVGVLEVRGTGQQVSPVSVRTLVLGASHSTVAVRGLLEHTTVTGPANTVSAQTTDLVRLLGNGSTVRATRGYTTRIAGDGNTAVFTWLDKIVVPGDRNRALVSNGRTTVRATGVGNRIRVHRRA